MDLNLKGKSVLITGASKGIGLVIAEVMAAEGCNLHIAARDEAAARLVNLSSRFNVPLENETTERARFSVEWVSRRRFTRPGRRHADFHAERPRQPAPRLHHATP